MDEKTRNNFKAMIYKRWEDDEMRDYCLKSTQEAVEFDGCFYEIEKPRIKTRFCYGYGCYLQATDEQEERANSMVHCAQNNASYFLNENLKDLTQEIEELEKEGATV